MANYYDRKRGGWVLNGTFVPDAKRSAAELVHTRPCYGQPDKSKMCEEICCIRESCHNNLYKYRNNKP